jgi:predicted transcriptional regulator
LSESNILNLYKTGNYLKVVRVIAESPKASEKIVKIINMQEITVADILHNLESQRAAEYVDKKWKLTDEGRTVLTKFF